MAYAGRLQVPKQASKKLLLLILTRAECASLTTAAAPAGRLQIPQEALRKKNVLITRGRFRPFTLLHNDMLMGAAQQFFCDPPAGSMFDSTDSVTMGSYDECVYRDDTMVLLELTTRDMMEVRDMPCLSPLMSSVPGQSRWASRLLLDLAVCRLMEMESLLGLGELCFHLWALKWVLAEWSRRPGHGEGYTCGPNGGTSCSFVFAAVLLCWGYSWTQSVRTHSCCQVKAVDPAGRLPQLSLAHAVLPTCKPTMPCA